LPINAVYPHRQHPSTNVRSRMTSIATFVKIAEAGGFAAVEAQRHPA